MGGKQDIKEPVMDILTSNSPIVPLGSTGAAWRTGVSEVLIQDGCRRMTTCTMAKQSVHTAQSTPTALALRTNSVW